MPKSKPLTKFNTLRKKLPAHYSVGVAKKLDGITSRQVLLVFRGEIKNPEIINKVYDAAVELAAETTLAYKRTGTTLSQKL